TKRVDELEKTHHYKYWREDLHLVREMGLRYLRYGPPYYRMHLGPDRYVWDFSDQAFAEMQRLGIVPIADLCHFGVPDWIGDFQNPDWPKQFARFARAFAERYPWVQLYTPVNEIFVCARMSGLHGQWNERKSDERSFVTATKHLCRANLLAIEEITRVRADAAFIQSESAEYFHLGGGDEGCRKQARFENERRFLSFDLLYSNRPSSDMCLYLLDNGMTRRELEWFMHHGLDRRIIMGNDFYETNEWVVAPGGQTKPAGEVFGWMPITRQYYERYRRPVMHTETNIQDAEKAVRWLWKEFFNVYHLRQEGVPVLGFTWFSLIDQVDWNTALAQDQGVVNPVGLYDLQRRPRAVAAAYREMLKQFGNEPLVPYSQVLSFYQQAHVPIGSQHAQRGNQQEQQEQQHSRPQPKPHHTISGRPPLPERAAVTIARTTDEAMDEDNVERLVREALAPLGGIERFIKPNQTVLIKPNQTMFRTADTGVTTDPRLVAALARMVRAAGAGTVQVGECTSCGQVTRDIMETTGMTRAARKAGAELVYFDEVEQVTVAVPQGQLVKEVPVPRPLLEADVVIACPKLKCHFMDPISGTIKLWVGCVRQDFGHHLHRDNPYESITDLMTVTRPDLVVMDAIWAGEGNGPIALDGRFVGCVLASDDPVALDVIAGDLAGFDGTAMQFPRAAARKGIGIIERDKIDVLGVPLAQARVPLKPTQMQDWTTQYPIRVIAGEGVTLGGTLGHFKGFADFWQKLHSWDAVVKLRGTPTFMIGRAEDPSFDQHLQEGPYIVLDDVALDKYKKDPRVTFIPGSPIGNEMMPVIMQALEVKTAGQETQKMIKRWNALRARWLYR
ncbi:MAG TPA: family 1 glycosylhydrolase, partial [Chloroflexota bacterium]|nr:family 1 glycosylhydrolase [Chloroflexota bacterium]